MHEIKLVIFDCDGVLMDSEVIAARAELEIYATYGIKMEPHEYAIRFAGKASEQIRIDLEEQLGRKLPDAVLDKVSANVDEKCGAEAPIIADAHAVLDRFDQARCICSNSPPEKLKSMLGRVGLYDRFRPHIFSARDFSPPAHKPRPDMILKAFREFEVEPDEALVVEDSVHGITAAIAAGARVVGFTGASHTFSDHGNQLMDAGAETVTNRLLDLPGVIEALSVWRGVDG